MLGGRTLRPRWEAALGGRAGWARQCWVLEHVGVLRGMLVLTKPEHGFEALPRTSTPTCTVTKVYTRTRRLPWSSKKTWSAAIAWQSVVCKRRCQRATTELKDACGGCGTAEDGVWSGPGLASRPRERVVVAPSHVPSQGAPALPGLARLGGQSANGARANTNFVHERSPQSATTAKKCEGA